MSGLATVGTVGAVGGVGVALLPAGVAGAAPVGFNVIDPYRSYDSRDFGPDGRLPAGFEQDIDVWTDWDGNPRIPQTAAAVTFNLTVARRRATGSWRSSRRVRSTAGSRRSTGPATV